MEKLRKLIVDTAESSGLDMSCLLSEPAMTSHLPWKLSWVTLENFVLENKLKAALLSSTAVNRENEKSIPIEIYHGLLDLTSPQDKTSSSQSQGCWRN